MGDVYPSMHWAVGCVSQHALGRGCILTCTGQGVVYPSMHWAGSCLPGGVWQTHPVDTTGYGQQAGRYASHWNAFLLM